MYIWSNHMICTLDILRELTEIVNGCPMTSMCVMECHKHYIHTIIIILTPGMSL